MRTSRGAFTWTNQCINHELQIRLVKKVTLKRLRFKIIDQETIFGYFLHKKNNLWSIIKKYNEMLAFIANT